MSLEKPNNPRRDTRREFMKGAAWTATVAGAGGAGIAQGMENVMEEINSHLLTPRVRSELKQRMGAVEEDITQLEKNLHLILNVEMHKILDKKR